MVKYLLHKTGKAPGAIIWVVTTENAAPLIGSVDRGAVITGGVLENNVTSAQILCVSCVIEQASITRMRCFLNSFLQVYVPLYSSSKTW